jgi:hypothetical protein
MLAALEIEFHQVLILGWLLVGGAALWLAQHFHFSRGKTVNILLPMALGLVIFSFYVSTRFNYDFLIDDIDIVQTNPDVVRADGYQTLWASDYWAGRSSDQNLYRPITILSYWVNAPRSRPPSNRPGRRQSPGAVGLLEATAVPDRRRSPPRASRPATTPRRGPWRRLPGERTPHQTSRRGDRSPPERRSARPPRGSRAPRDREDRGRSPGPR